MDSKIQAIGDQPRARGTWLAVYFDAARMRFPLRVTAPVRAKTRPVTLAPVVMVSLIFARMLPAKAVLVPSVAKLPTCQNTFPAVAPLARTTEDLLAVVSVVPILVGTLRTSGGLHPDRDL